MVVYNFLLLYHRWAELLIASQISLNAYHEAYSYWDWLDMFFKDFELNLSEVPKKKKDQLSFHYFSFSFTSELPGFVRAKVKIAKTPRERLLSQYFWLTKNFLRKPVSMRLQFQFYRPKKTQDSSDKVQISIQIFSSLCQMNH